MNRPTNAISCNPTSSIMRICTGPGHTNITFYETWWGLHPWILRDVSSISASSRALETHEEADRRLFSKTRAFLPFHKFQRIQGKDLMLPWAKLCFLVPATRKCRFRKVDVGEKPSVGGSIPANLHASNAVGQENSTWQIVSGSWPHARHVISLCKPRDRRRSATARAPNKALHRKCWILGEVLSRQIFFHSCFSTGGAGGGWGSWRYGWQTTFYRHFE